MKRLLTLTLLLLPALALGHPGGRASDGCHYCRKNCDKHGVVEGERHCHGGSESKAESKAESVAPASKGQQSGIPHGSRVYVEKVSDGDTLKGRLLSTGGDKITVRILGIDCPESSRNSKCKKEGAAACEAQIPKGKAAGQRGAALLKGQTVTLESGDGGPLKPDVYKRPLAYVRLADGSDYGLTMIREGFCADYSWKYPHARQDEYKTVKP